MPIFLNKMIEILIKPNRPKPNFDQGDILLIYVLGFTCLLILFVIILTSPDIPINLVSCVIKNKLHIFSIELF